MAASAAITGGIGPWLPFQMWALGWVGSGAGLVKKITRGKAPVTSLALYGWLAGIAFGLIINLWFWPFLRGTSDLSWSPGASAGTTAVHYWRFYVLTSLAWDSARALVNVILLISLGRPVLKLLARFRSRFVVTWAPPASPLGSTMDA